LRLPRYVIAERLVRRLLPAADPPNILPHRAFDDVSDFFGELGHLLKGLFDLVANAAALCRLALRDRLARSLIVLAVAVAAILRVAKGLLL